MIKYQMQAGQMQQGKTKQSIVLEHYQSYHSYPSPNNRQSQSFAQDGTSELSWVRQNLIITMRQEEEAWVVDRYFHKSYRIIREQCKNYLIFLVLRTTILIPVTILNPTLFNPDQKPHSQLFQTFLNLSLLYNVLDLARRGYFYWAHMNSKTRVYQIAHDMHHALRVEELNQGQEGEERVQKEEDSGLLVSHSLYDFENMERNEEVSEEFKTIRQNNGAVLIKMHMEGTFWRLLDGLLGLASLALFVLGIVAASRQPPITDTQHTILELILLSEVLFRPKVYVFCVFLVVIPAVLILLVLCICCCRKGQPEAKLPEAVEATPQIVANCAECSICFQTIAIGSKVVVLPCSHMHVFDENCIRGWTKVKPNCPICRHDLV